MKFMEIQYTARLSCTVQYKRRKKFTFKKSKTYFVNVAWNSILHPSQSLNSSLLKRQLHTNDYIKSRSSCSSHNTVEGAMVVTTVSVAKHILYTVRQQKVKCCYAVVSMGHLRPKPYFSTVN